VTETLKHSTIHYLDELDVELSRLPGYKKPEKIEKEKLLIKSKTDNDCGYIHQERKKGLGYLTEMTVDIKHGIITGVDCYPANKRESDIILKHLKMQMEKSSVQFGEIALDAGYDVGAVHRGLELLNIKGYCSTRNYHNNAMKKGFIYHPEEDSFTCDNGKKLRFEAIIYKKSQQNYYRIYSIKRSECKGCSNLQHCSVDKGRVRINASAYYPSFYQNQQRCKTKEYLRMKRLRNIWSEGTFAALKREHNLNRIRKRGIVRAREECLLSAMALNLKRMAKAIHNKIISLFLEIWKQVLSRFMINKMILSTGPLWDRPLCSGFSYMFAVKFGTG